jgi:serine protease Do
VRTAARLRNRVVLRGAGAEVKLEVWRSGRLRDVTVRLRKEESADGAGEPERGSAPEPDRGKEAGLAGISVTPATPALLKRRGLSPDGRGLLVTSIDRSRASGFMGLLEGDLILDVNGVPVEDVADMEQELEKGGPTALLRIRRGTGTVFLAVPR